MTLTSIQLACRAPFALVAMALALAGCAGGMDAVSDNLTKVNPFYKPPTLAKGERREILAGNQTIIMKGGAASVGPTLSRTDWPQAGGPLSNDIGNVAINLSGQVLWSAAVGGRIASGGTLGFGGSARSEGRPVISGDRAVLYDPTGDVTAVSISSGAVLWKTPLARGSGVFGGGAAIADGRVYVTTGFATVAALDLGSGRVFWTRKLTRPARTAPAIAGAKVMLVNADNQVLAFDAASGAPSWTAGGAQGNATLVTTAGLAVSGGLVIAPLGSGDVLAIDIASGSQRWAISVSGGARTLAVSGLGDASASPVVADGLVVATGAGGRTVAARVSDGTVVWDQPIGSGFTPTISGNAVFLVDLENHAVALDRASGAVLWSTALPINPDKNVHTVFAGPLLANGRLVFISNDRVMIALDAASGQILGQSSTSISAASAPVVAGGVVLVYGSDGVLTALR